MLQGDGEILKLEFPSSPIELYLKPLLLSEQVNTEYVPF